MKPVTLAVTLNIADQVQVGTLPAAVKALLTWVLMNDVTGAEALTYGPIDDKITVEIAREPLETLPSPEALLSSLSDEQLIQEVVRRGDTLIPSIWTIDDFRPLIEADDDCQELSDEQCDEIALALLAKCSRLLPEVLAEQGNNWTEERWLDHKDELLAAVQSKPEQPPLS